MLLPPPPAPKVPQSTIPVELAVDELFPLQMSSGFHTASVPNGYRGLGLLPGSNDSNEVPPVLVTHGWLAGSSCSMGAWSLKVPSLMHSKAPVSPEDANMLWPCAAICSKMRFSASA